MALLDKIVNPSEGEQKPAAPSISLPKGGGAIRGIGEKFAANPVTGTGSMTIPIALSPERSGFSPQLSLSYDSGSGNGPFGFGWSFSIPAITRKTDKGLPKYQDADESDVFILSSAEDLVPVFKKNPDGSWVLDPKGSPVIDDNERDDFLVRCYRPRIEGLFARIERWTNKANGEVHWRSISKDNITTLYGRDNNSRIFYPADADPDHPTRVFSWLICDSYDDKGNAIVYEYAAENDDNVNCDQANERNRVRTSNRYLKRIMYGNRTPNRDATTWQATDPAQLPNNTWMFEVVFDYGEGHYTEDAPDAQGSIFAQAQIDPPAGSHWPVRQDPFSTYRAGFEVRTYRLCRGVLMFHHFPQELGINDYLVRSTGFSYSESPIASFISRVTQSGYVRQPIQNQPNRYLKKSLPPLEFEYSQAPSPEQLAQQPIRDVDAESLKNLPVGLDGASYQWIDLDGEGTSGILTEQADGWYYKRNLSANRQVIENGCKRTVADFGPTEVVARKPVGGLSSGAQFLDLAGDGQIDLVQMEGSVRGFYERTDDASWAPFRPFVSWPNLNTRDLDLRFVNLTGDGHADILITEGDALTWYPSLAEEGFGPAVRLSLPLDEEKGPRLVFADGLQSIYLADLSGDGLSDLVRIRNGEVCYWPNLGYGHFGAKVTMDDAPWFDAPDQFDQRRIILADIDGSGTTDILYLRRDGVQIYFNQSGNRWSNTVPLPQFAPIDNISSVQALDLLGNGTACLVWSSPLPGDARRPMRYMALMEEKPHLLIGVKNNLGAETKVHYTPSTKFYLNDKRDGKPWITRLPFPVHVIERVETYDYISRNRFVTRYTYHHGYFDGVEREFRGFGMVEQWDTEEFVALSVSDAFPVGDNIDTASHVPLVLMKTWFHTGVYLGRGHVSDFFAGLLDANDVGEYWREPDPNDVNASALLPDALAKALLLPDTVLPAGLTLEEEREACRALKGSMLRQEVYALDGTAKAEHPYTVAEQNFSVHLEQPQDQNRHAVFFTHPREAITYHYERTLVPVLNEQVVDEVTAGTNPDVKWLPDPRVAHTLTLEVDPFGNVLKEAAIGYGRRQPDSSLPLQADRDKQTKTLITYTENRVTKPIVDVAVFPDDYRTPLPCEARTYELTGFKPENNAARFSFDEWTRNGFALPASAMEIPYEQTADNVAKQKRLIEQVRTLYRRDDLTGPLPLGDLQSLALPFENYKLAFTPGLVAEVYGGRVSETMLENEGRYVHSEDDANWWIPSGQVFYSPDPADTPAQELAYAQSHFFLPRRTRDPFHTDTVSTESFVTYDAYDLLMVETCDALGNHVTVGERDAADNLTISGNDYRVLQPWQVMDPNRNRAQVAFDALGMVVGTAMMGKPEENLGDSLDGFAADLTGAVVLDHLQNPLADPHSILGRATTRLVYDLFAYHRTKSDPDPQPAVVYTLARETHDTDLESGQQTKVQHSFSYSDGFGREIQKKIQAEPGPLVEGGSEVSPRWVGSGWTIFNNKGKPIRKYEPFFTDTHCFDFAKIVGVSPILFYDPVERVVATLHPNHTYEKVVFDPWQQETWDVNDTVLMADPKTDADVGDFFSRLPSTDYLPTWHAQRQGGALGAQEQVAANKAAAHADTPTVAYFDTLGRIFLTLTDNGPDPAQPDKHLLFAIRFELDIEGNQREVRDALSESVDDPGRVVVRYAYSIAGPAKDQKDAAANRIHQASMEAGERWILNDVAGKPLYAWDSRGHQFRTAYDPLRRPTESFMREGAGVDMVVGRTVYGESWSNPEASNPRGKVVQVFDQAGVVTSDQYDFKGNLLRSQRQLAVEYKATLNWSGTVPLEAETHASSTRYDALNRPTEVTAPDNSIIRPAYNEANLLERMEANVRGAASATPFVIDIDYDAKGQRTMIAYGNGVTTEYRYDPETFRLIRLTSTRGASFPADERMVQDLSYTYDPAGNITHIGDDAQQTIYFNGQVVIPQCDYAYDAIYRLINATGREHIGQTTLPQTTWNDEFRINLPQPGDGQAMRNYTEQYWYDAVGNFENLIHQAANGNWTRAYTYTETSQLEAGKMNNRLSNTAVGSSTPETYPYDAHGNITAMSHLPLMRWDYRDQLQATAQQAVNNDGTPETTYYVYDAAGQRVRKVTERQAAAGEAPRRKAERIYLGGFEIHREYNGAGDSVTLERETLHIMDDKQRIALVETRTQGADPRLPQLIRYQFGNHLGSASLELDDQAQIISYEEYTPYGSTSYQAVSSQTETPKRYRYTGMERDEESGLEYHGARYYASWLGRWTAVDPLASKYPRVTPYQFAGNTPISFVDLDGLQPIQDPLLYKEFDVVEDRDPSGNMMSWIRIGTTWQGSTKVIEVTPNGVKPSQSSVTAQAPMTPYSAAEEAYLKEQQHFQDILSHCDPNYQSQANQTQISAEDNSTTWNSKENVEERAKQAEVHAKILKMQKSDWVYGEPGSSIGVMQTVTDPETYKDALLLMLPEYAAGKLVTKVAELEKPLMTWNKYRTFSSGVFKGSGSMRQMGKAYQLYKADVMGFNRFLQKAEKGAEFSVSGLHFYEVGKKPFEVLQDTVVKK